MNTCKDCGEPDDEITTDGQCRVCWEMENNPESFVLTEEQHDDMVKLADYIIKHDITPNLDSIY